MYLNALTPAPGSKKNTKRLGRGQASGTGGTAGRGNKGAGARASAHRRFYFEGGQMPIYRHLPKRGFKNLFRENVQIVNLDNLARLQLTEIDLDVMAGCGLIKKLNQPVKVLGRCEINTPVHIKAHAFSATAKAKIEAAGGKAEIL